MTCHRITSFFTILMAGSFIFQYASKSPANDLTNYVSWLAALLAGADVILGFSKKADLHQTLKRQFNELQSRMIEGDGQDSTWLKHYSDRLSIEADEPQKYVALDLLCHNETTIALKCDKGYLEKLNWFQVLTADFIKWKNLTADL